MCDTLGFSREASSGEEVSLKNYAISARASPKKEPSKDKSGSKGVILLLGGCGIGVFIGRFGKTSWHDWSRGRVCGAER